jgi:hypothetical protein
MAYAAQLHKLELFPGFDGMILDFLGNPTPHMPPRRLHWSRRLNRPCMDPEPELMDPDHLFTDPAGDEDAIEVLVLRGEMIRFGDTEVQYAWRRNENELPTITRGPARAAPRHAWCMGVLNTHQDDDFFEAWRRTHNARWPFVGTPAPSAPGSRMRVSIHSIHPQLLAHFNRSANFADAWAAVEACYIGSPEIDAASQALGRNAWLHVQRDSALRRLREMARNLPFAWAI